MASLENRNGHYRVVFRFAGRKFTRALKTSDTRAANACLARLEDNIRRAELGLLAVPDDADVIAFLLSDGQFSGKPKTSSIRTLKQLCDGYFASVPNGAIEESSLCTLRIQTRHLRRLLGDSLPIRTLGSAELQRFIDKRSKEKGRRGRALTPTTIKKDLSALSTMWTWARHVGAVNHPLPKYGLKFPKTQEKPPFQTREEIDRKIRRGGLSEVERDELWDCLVLTLPEIDQLLTHVKGAARHPFIYPMLVFAAHTGARRSEIMRSGIDDVDLGSETIILREKKRARGQLTTRRVPITPLLGEVLAEWFSVHPGGNHTFCLDLHVPRSTTKRTDFVPLTRSEATDHFKRTLRGSKWEKLRGWHVLRHSFASNCAAKGIDQRIIDEWMGHQTDEMRRRYRHLFPDQQQQAIRQVFGE